MSTVASETKRKRARSPELKDCVVNPGTRKASDVLRVVAFDLETSGLRTGRKKTEASSKSSSTKPTVTRDHKKQADEIIEWGVYDAYVDLRTGVISRCRSFFTFAKPSQPIKDIITQVTGIKNSDLTGAPNQKLALQAVTNFLTEDEEPFFFLSFNGFRFDMLFVENLCETMGLKLLDLMHQLRAYGHMDLRPFVQAALPGHLFPSRQDAGEQKASEVRSSKSDMRLTNIHYRLVGTTYSAHRASVDAEATLKVLLAACSHSDLAFFPDLVKSSNYFQVYSAREHCSSYCVPVCDVTNPNSKQNFFRFYKTAVRNSQSSMNSASSKNLGSVSCAKLTEQNEACDVEKEREIEPEPESLNYILTGLYYKSIQSEC